MQNNNTQNMDLINLTTTEKTGTSGVKISPNSKLNELRLPKPAVAQDIDVET
jgi:hypothetical protein